MLRTIERSRLWDIQTPQVTARGKFVLAFALAVFHITVPRGERRQMRGRGSIVLSLACRHRANDERRCYVRDGMG